MRWEGERESENVEDVRGASGGGFGSGMLGGMSGRQVAFHGGWGSLLLILLISVIFHVNPLQLLQGPQQVSLERVLLHLDVRARAAQVAARYAQQRLLP